MHLCYQIIPFWHHWKPSHTYWPLKALEFCKQHCNLRRCHSIRQRHTIGSLRRTLRCILATAMFLTLALSFLFLMTIVVCRPSRCFLLLLNAHYCCIIQLRMSEVLVSLCSITGILHSSGTSRCLKNSYACPLLQGGEPDWFTVSQIYSIPRGTINVLGILPAHILRIQFGYQ